jgi:hypothetical protein
MRRAPIVLPGSESSVSRSRSVGGAIVLVAMAIAASAVTACSSTASCADRGGAQTYNGSEQYVGTLDTGGDAGAGNGVFGSMPTVTSLDWNPRIDRPTTDEHQCSGEPLAVTLGTCTLSGTLTSSRFDTGKSASGAFIAATASIDPGQTCTFPTSAGTATVKLDSGTINWDGPSSLRVEFAGAITDWSGSAPRAGYLTYTFNGAL